MSDEEWAFFEPFVIETGPRRGRRPKNHRLVLDGVFWIARTGSPWRDLHDHFGKWSSVYRQFRRWTLSGVWDVLLGALNDRGEGQDSLQMVDSTVVRAHQHAASAQKKRVMRAKVWPFAWWLLDQDPFENQRPGPSGRGGPDRRRGL
jgi:transposase